MKKLLKKSVKSLLILTLAGAAAIYMDSLLEKRRKKEQRYNSEMRKIYLARVAEAESILDEKANNEIDDENDDIDDIDDIFEEEISSPDDIKLPEMDIPEMDISETNVPEMSVPDVDISKIKTTQTDIPDSMDGDNEAVETLISEPVELSEISKVTNRPDGKNPKNFMDTSTEKKISEDLEFTVLNDTTTDSTDDINIQTDNGFIHIPAHIYYNSPSDE